MFYSSRHCEPLAVKEYSCIFSGSHKGLPLPLTGQFPDCFAFQARNDGKEKVKMTSKTIISFAMKRLISLSFLLFLFANVCAQEIKSQNTLAFDLCQLSAIDQTIRTTEYFDILKKEWAKADSLNFNKFIEFVKENGFPNEKLVGEENWTQGCVKMAGFIYLVHNPKRVAGKFYNLFKDEVDKGNLSPTMFSYALDRYYVSVEGRSYFDTPYKVWTTANGVCLQDRAKSDSLRASIGLEPLPESAFINCSKMEISDKPDYNKPFNLIIPD
ncbi:MAG: hypothetical protein LBL79_13085 [Prevotella sp.]|nr:hypothetical protein [Prevotella sp.]